MHKIIQIAVFTLFLLLILLLSGCSDLQLDAGQTPTETGMFKPPQKTVTSEINPSITITDRSINTPPTLTVTPQSKATVSATTFPAPISTKYQNTLYNLQVQLDYASHQLTVNEQIEFTNATPDDLLTLILMVAPRRYPGAFELEALTWEDGTPITQRTWRDTQLIILLPSPLETGQRVTIQLVYQLFLPQTSQYANTRPRPFGYTDKQVNLGDWYPFIPPYKTGQGWLAHEVGIFGEYLVYDSADYEIKLELTGETQDLVIAASAPALKDNQSLHYQHKNARSFALSISPYFQIAEDIAQNSDGSDIHVLSYYFPLDEKAGKRVLQTTIEALQVYSQLFGPYHHQTITAVQADFLDGMEYDGLFYLSKDYYNWHNGTASDLLVTIAAHETAHQWWYGLVGNDQALEPWLDEALCTYSERLFFENVYPDSLDWWWTYRVNYYKPHGQIDIDVYTTSEDTFSYFNDYRNVVYLNGATFLEELRTLIGDRSFFAFLKDYREQYSYQQVTTQDFFNLLKEHTYVNLEPLLNEFFRLE